MQFYFIRHAQSENNALWARTKSEEGRSPDPLLTEVGEQQAAQLAQFLAEERPADNGEAARDGHNRQGFHFTHLYSSLMTRAVQTGAAVAQAMSLSLRAWQEIHEHGGLFSGNHAAQNMEGIPGPGRGYFEQKFPALQLPDSLDESGWWNRPYEDRPETFTRARQFLQNLKERHGRSEDRVAIISHGGFYYAFMAALLGFPPIPAEDTNPVWLRINNVAISRIDFHPTHTQVMYLNRVDFLPDPLIT